MTNRNLLLIAFAVLLTCFPSILGAQEKVEKFSVPSNAIKVQAHLVNEAKVGDGEQYSMKVDGGTRKAGARIVYCVEIKNSLDMTVRIERLSLPCKCTKVAIDGKVIAPGDSILALVFFQASATKAGEHSLPIKFVEEWGQ